MMGGGKGGGGAARNNKCYAGAFSRPAGYVGCTITMGKLAVHDPGFTYAARGQRRCVSRYGRCDRLCQRVPGGHSGL